MKSSEAQKEEKEWQISNLNHFKKINQDQSASSPAEIKTNGRSKWQIFSHA